MSEKSTTALTNGEAKLMVDGGEIWYKVSGEARGTPIVLLHGGPGYSSFYLKPLEELGDQRQVIRYDQLGAGKSDIIMDTSIFTLAHYVDELEALRKHLDVDNWHVLGHSWGTILAFEYYRNYPESVSSLILGSPCIDIDAWERSTNQLLQTLPDSLEQAVRVADSTGNYENALYEVGINTFYDKYLWGDKVITEDLDSLVATANIDIYYYMWGPSEFRLRGTLQGYNVSHLLHEIEVPVLFTVGEFDEILPSIVQDMASKVRNAKVVVLAGASHMTTWNAREENIKAVRDFLNSVDH